MANHSTSPTRAATIEALATPCLVLDLDSLEHNIRNFQTLAREAGVSLRPHAKAHRTTAITARQIAEGAIGVACATLGEAEALVERGVHDLLLTSLVTAPAAIRRLAELNRVCPISVVVDDMEVLGALDRAAAQTGVSISVLIDLDLGQNRTGAPTPAQAVILARAARSASALTYRGVQAYWGHLQGVVDLEERRHRVLDAAAHLEAFLGALKNAGLVPEVVTGGGTGTTPLDARLGLFTELQPGSYALGDGFYGDAALWGPIDPPFRAALTLRMTVLKIQATGRLIVDAGAKTLGLTYTSSCKVTCEGRSVLYRPLGDEYGELAFPESLYRPGDAIEIVPPHAALAINGFSEMLGRRGMDVTERLPIDARGR